MSSVNVASSEQTDRQRQEAEPARASFTYHTFVSSTNRLPDQVVPPPALVRVLDQGATSASVGFATAAALNYLRAEQGDQTLVSPFMLYDLARRYDEWGGEQHDGSTLIAAMTALSRHGVSLDQEWPSSNPSNELSPEAAQAALRNRPVAYRHVEKNVDHLRAAVFEYHAVVVAAQIHQGWNKPDDEGAIPFGRGRIGPQRGLTGGHAFAVIGYTSKGFLVQNSWGLQWGGVSVGDVSLPGVALWQYEDAAKNLVEAWIVQLSARTFRTPLVGYDADSLGGDDLLEIKTEVNAFSYVLASRVIKPPLALGLFGEWGSGKSFFMREMQKKVNALGEMKAEDANAKDNGAADTPFCRNIIQIHFNAWHYLDTDLWASLVTEIFDKLFQGIGGATGKPEEKLPALKEELQTANGVYKQAQDQLTDAEKQRSDAETALQSAIAEREAREGELATQLNDMVTLVAGRPEVQQNVERLAADLGVPELRTSYDALDARATELKTLGKRFSALGEAIFASPWGWLRIGTLLLALIAPALVVLVIELVRRRFGANIEGAHSLALQISTTLTALAAWVGAQMKRGQGLLKVLEDTHRDLERIRDDRRKTAVAAEQAALASSKAKETAARKSLQEAEQRVQTLQREIADLQPGRLIARFIEERTKSADYRSRLGVVSFVRRDFERLSELSDPESDKRNPELMPVERIILYIDDLDRCSPARVIEVLEAVHLLLAFRLFMVVVAVDPRWLRRCLEKQYPELLTRHARGVDPVAHVVPSRPATAQDYLEKIFQIPFSLQPLKDDGYRRMIRGLTSSNVVTDVSSRVVGVAPGQDAAPPPAPPLRVGLPDQSQADATIEQTQQKTPAPAPAEPDEPDADERAIERLRIQEWELDDIERLAPLFRTPRAVKRFVNTYRFVRAGIRPHELAMFEGRRDQPGTYRAALVLLAIVVSYSNIAPRFLRRLVDHADRVSRDSEWLQFLSEARADGDAPRSSVKQAKPEAGTRKRKTAPAPTADAAAVRSWEAVEWRQLCDALAGISDDEFPVRELGDLRPWIRTVSRYSFSLAAFATVD